MVPGGSLGGFAVGLVFRFLLCGIGGGGSGGFCGLWVLFLLFSATGRPSVLQQEKTTKNLDGLMPLEETKYIIFHFSGWIMRIQSLIEML